MITTTAERVVIFERVAVVTSSIFNAVARATSSGKAEALKKEHEMQKRSGLFYVCCNGNNSHLIYMSLAGDWLSVDCLSRITNEEPIATLKEIFTKVNEILLLHKLQGAIIHQDQKNWVNIARVWGHETHTEEIVLIYSKQKVDKDGRKITNYN